MVDKAKIQRFFEYNKENIYMNLLQAEDHARFTEDLDHAQCLLKHLLFVLGELKEMEQHASVVKPEIVEKVKELRNRVYDLYRRIREKQIQPSEIAREIWNLRKEFESIVPEFDTNRCTSIVCEIASLIREGEDMAKEERLEDVKVEGDVLGLGELVKLCWKKCYEKLGKDAPAVEKFRFVWECIREGDPVSPDILKKMKEVGWTPKAAPMCVIAKMVKENKTRWEAEAECIEEGKLHPMNVYAFLAKYGHEE